MIIGRISRFLSDFDNLMPVFAGACALLFVLGILLLPLPYSESQLYPKRIDRASSLDPYDRGGPPFTQANISMQYPENSPTAGYVTTYLTPFSWWLSTTTLHLGTTIVAHPGGILDEILYNTRGLDTVVEPTILFIAFAIASYLFRKGI
ncbi:MAG: EhaF family protein [Methanomicrobiales archaeon]|nr:EhaF family protein [Methanomicrobiales archaeon]MDD1646635.1 EhaF family protein [Methanomicrobiales archaeon]MDD1648608.1 EhaF family protein [Methanomicrobiales archaeon]